MIRLLYALGVLGLAALTLVPAQSDTLWRLSVVATEWGHIVAAAALIPLRPGWQGSRAARVAVPICLLAFCVALAPTVRSAMAAHDLDTRMDATFGMPMSRFPCGAGERPPTLDAGALLFGSDPRAVPTSKRTYARTNGETLTLDLRLPEPRDGCTAAAPAVVVVHSGSWQNGTSEEFAPLADHLARQGYVVASINYRLAPRWPFPAARDDVLAAVEYLKREAAALGVDRGRIALLGRSAGSQLALSAAYAAKDPDIRGVIGFYGPADMRWAHANPRNPAVIDSRGTVEAYLGGPPEKAAAAYDAASPINFVDTSPPTLLIHGGRDDLVSTEHSRRLNTQLDRAGRPHILLELPWATHACDYNFNGPCGQISRFAVERFLASVMK